MLNPDGVIIGNYRCSLTGRDMNRNFRRPRQETFPIIYHLKELLKQLQSEQREVLLNTTLTRKEIASPYRFVDPSLL